MPGEEGKHSQITNSEFTCHTVGIVPQQSVLGQGSAFSPGQVAILSECLAGGYQECGPVIELVLAFDWTMES
ncbi:hypothetical protein N7499_002935 [Penicillium canescens]|uniref:Uncharacterized protein n=1 Tax=Penicillium canescens TaxID=5083 RepID=A0AAD6IB08_PENCN|nr:uncharacterized protein N7446_014106 [Penicillium canescens]XP_058368369.1 uncharacterized protein N7446_010788 [Penicillium canescens]KAJ5981572.1 hypothetical protein N7522_013556 [Penicillium canescens]KAJ6003571.1 hypothetical protein N7522_006263 [Penicillium canescens]KAJ6022304.1 hypothetical protein N7460_014048 [Penicillium canescens]KAJ6038954.1 hypothetical protein N7446_014106 [Penicillium canescens]KAJ6041318.1 hypothetical protein N7460_006708 [Penicillium canescens]